MVSVKIQLRQQTRTGSVLAMELVVSCGAFCEPGDLFTYFIIYVEESRWKRIHVGYVAKQDWRTILKRLLEHGDPHWQQQLFDNAT